MWLIQAGVLREGNGLMVSVPRKKQLGKPEIRLFLAAELAFNRKGWHVRHLLNRPVCGRQSPLARSTGIFRTRAELVRRFAGAPQYASAATQRGDAAPQ